MRGTQPTTPLPSTSLSTANQLPRRPTTWSRRTEPNGVFHLATASVLLPGARRIGTFAFHSITSETLPLPRCSGRALRAPGRRAPLPQASPRTRARRARRTTAVSDTDFRQPQTVPNLVPIVPQGRCRMVPRPPGEAGTSPRRSRNDVRHDSPTGSAVAGCGAIGAKSARKPLDRIRCLTPTAAQRTARVGSPPCSRTSSRRPARIASASWRAAGRGAARCRRDASATAWQRADGRVVVRAPDEESLATARFMLALDDDTGAVPRAVRRDPLIGPSARALVGYRPLRLATVTHAVVRALCGQLVEARRARAIERAIARACGETVVTQRRRSAGSRRSSCAASVSPSTVRPCSPASRPTVDLERLRDLPADDVAARLARERGIGPWSVGVISLEGLGPLDRGLVGDLSLVKLHAALTGRWVEGQRDGGAPRPVRGVAGSRRRDPAPRLVARARPRARPSTAHESPDAASAGLHRVRYGSRRATDRGPRRRADRRGADLRASLLRLAQPRRDRRLRVGAPSASRSSPSATGSRRRSTTSRRRREPRSSSSRSSRRTSTRSSNRSARRSRPSRRCSPSPRPRRRRRSRRTSRAGVPVVRAMPNTPSTVHEGIAGLCAGAHADDAHVTLAEEALAHLGSVVRVPERYMDAVTAVSGSGPAYFALLAEAMIEAGPPARPLARDLDAARRPDDARHGEAAPRRGSPPRRAARDGDLARRHHDRGHPRARVGRRSRRVSQRDPGRDERARELAAGAD